MAESGFERFQTRLREQARHLDLDVAPTQLERFERYARLLAEGNRHVNLTAIDQPDDIIDLHILDAIGVWPKVEEELRDAFRHPQSLRLVDVGTGAGLPGLPIKIWVPDTDLTLIDGTRKKTRFLERTIQALDLQRVQVIHGRSEELAHHREHRAAYHVAVARGLAPLPTLLEYLLPFVRVGGLCIAYKGPGLPAELRRAGNALRRLHAEVVRVIPLRLPGTDVRRLVAVVRKEAPTPGRYPRGQGLPRRAPL